MNLLLLIEHVVIMSVSKVVDLGLILWQNAFVAMFEQAPAILGEFDEIMVFVSMAEQVSKVVAVLQRINTIVLMVKH